MHTVMRPESYVQPVPSGVPTPTTVDVLGIRLALTDYEGMLDWIDAMVASRERGYLCACNVHTVMASHEDPVLRGALTSSSVNVPDGQPLVWAINALGHPLRGRVYGPELMARACARAAASSGHSRAAGNFSARYSRIASDSHTGISPSISTGTLPTGE